MSNFAKVATMSRLDAALVYAAVGLAVLPVRAHSKVPLTEHGVKDASADEATIRAWWSKWPDANVAIACGPASGGLVVLDVDGDKGRESLRALENRIGPLPSTCRVRTGRGEHYYFSAAAGVRTQVIASGLELRGEGVYVLAPPSLHPNGMRYELVGDVERVALPAALHELLGKQPAVATIAPTGDGEKVREGQRSSYLTSVAGSMRRRGMTAEAIQAALIAENERRCDPPLTETEVRKIATSVARYQPVLKTAPATIKTEPEAGAEDHGPYFIQDGCTVYLKQTKDAIIPVRLANFSAHISEEIILDDGRDPLAAFQIEGTLATGKTLPSVRVPAEKFSAMNWVPEQWGARPVVAAGQGTRDRLREAIQRLSGEIVQRRIFRHTGWRKVEGTWVFLHAGGALGREGIEVWLPNELRRYSLPAIPKTTREAIEASLSLLSVAPLRITAPLWAGIFRAPLAAALPIDVSLFLYGPTGALKSTLAALFLSHFGDFNRTSLPGSWSSTGNQLEHRAFLLKDLPFAVDDYAPSPLDARELESKAARLLRAQGNLLGRGRLRSDLTERDPFPPRGLIISTGEQHPIGQSILARTLIVTVEPGAVKMEALNEAQEATGSLPDAMAAYLQWLAPQMDVLPKLLSETFTGARDRAHSIGAHLRVPEALAHLWLGMHTGLLFAEEQNVLSHDRAETLRNDCWDAFLKLGEEQSRTIEAERPTRRFLEVLATILAQGRGLVLNKWNAPSDGARATFLGWADDSIIYLLPEAAFQEVARFCRESGEPFPVRHERLFRDLKRDKLTDCDRDRTLKSIKIEGEKHRLLCVRKKAAETLIGDTFEVRVPSVPGFSG